ITDAGDNEVTPDSTLTLTIGDSAVFTVTVLLEFTGEPIGAEALECDPDNPVSGEGAYNSATVSWGSTNTDTDDTCLPLPALADVSIVKTVSTGVALSGDTITWTLQVQNLGPATATDVVVSDEFPSGFTAQSSSNSTCVVTASELECLVGDLAVGDVLSIQVVGLVAASPGSLENVAAVTTTSIDPNSENNRDDAALTVLSPLALTGNTWASNLLVFALVVLGLGMLAILSTRGRRKLTN
ncbi:MAG: DUF11 domain-containing protein, partial [Beutenbergiaceae bacterium]